MKIIRVKREDFRPENVFNVCVHYLCLNISLEYLKQIQLNISLLTPIHCLLYTW